MDYLTEEKGWSIVLYEKIGTTCTEIAVLWEETTTAEEAYETWLEPFGSLPPKIAVDHALSFDDDVKREYEARLYCGKKGVAMMQWPKEAVQECIDDAKSRKVKKFIIAAEVTLDIEESDNFEEWDLEELIMLDSIKLLDSTPIDEVD
jgi:hypothetical protein